MGNTIQRGSLDMSKYKKEATFQETPTLTYDMLQSVVDINDKVLTKDITSVTQQLNPASQLELLKKIQSQPFWLTLIRFDESKSLNEKANIMHTKISAHTLENEIQALKRGNLQPQIKNCWFIVTNLLLAVMDMEHRLDFHDSLTTKNIFLNADRTLAILNPLFKQSLLQQMLADVVGPSKNCRIWKEDFEKSYYARMTAIEDTKDILLRNIHCVQQNKVQKMCESVGLVGLCLITLTTEQSFMIPESNSLDWDKITDTFEFLEQTFPDKELLGLIRQMILDAPKSLIASYDIFTEAKLKLMTDGFRTSNFICADQIRANDLVNELKSLNSKYSINLNKQSKHGNRPKNIQEMPLPKWIPATHPVPGYVAPSPAAKVNQIYRPRENEFFNQSFQGQPKLIEPFNKVEIEGKSLPVHESVVQEDWVHSRLPVINPTAPRDGANLGNERTIAQSVPMDKSDPKPEYHTDLNRDAVDQKEIRLAEDSVPAIKLEMLPLFKNVTGVSSTGFDHKKLPDSTVTANAHPNPLQKGTPSLNSYHRCSIPGHSSCYTDYRTSHDYLKLSCKLCHKAHCSSCLCVAQACLCGKYNCGVTCLTGLRPHSYCHLRGASECKLNPAPSVLYYDEPYYGRLDYRSGLWYHH